jgi:transposase-like protein
MGTRKLTIGCRVHARRPRYSGQESISAVARRQAMCPSQLFTWRRELRKQIEAQSLSLPPRCSFQQCWSRLHRARHFTIIYEAAGKHLACRDMMQVSHAHTNKPANREVISMRDVQGAGPGMTRVEPPQRGGLRQNLARLVSQAGAPIGSELGYLCRGHQIVSMIPSLGNARSHLHGAQRRRLAPPRRRPGPAQPCP